MIIDNFIARIRRHSREQYRQLVNEGVTELRIWIQEHGEQALIAGLIVGAVVVLAFKFVLFLFLLAIACLMIVFLVAQSEAGSHDQAAGFQASAPSNPLSESVEVHTSNGAHGGNGASEGNKKSKGSHHKHTGSHSLREDEDQGDSEKPKS